MALEKTKHLHRIRIVFDPSGAVSMVETVHHNAVREDGNVIAKTEDTVKTYTAAKMAPAVSALIKEIERVGAEDDAIFAAREAEAARAAEEAKAKSAA